MIAPARTFNVGVCGLGVVAGYGHLPAIAAHPHLDLAAVYDPLAGRAEEVARRFGATFATGDEDAFFARDLDAVVVCSPLGAHRANVLRAAERGFHVLCEKPIAESDEVAAEMQAAMSGAGKLFAIGFVYRASHVTKTIHRWIAEGALGDVRLIRLSYLWDLHGRYSKDADGVWREDPRWRGRMLEGGPMVDCGVHFLDLARLFAASDFVEGSGNGAWLADYEAPDYVIGSLEHESGCRTVIEVGFSYGHTAKAPRDLFSYDVVGTGGTARYVRDGWILERRSGDGTLTLPGASEKDFAGMYDAFATALRTGHLGSLSSAEEARSATRWALKITRDATESRGIRQNS